MLVFVAVTMMQCIQMSSRWRQWTTLSKPCCLPACCILPASLPLVSPQYNKWCSQLQHIYIIIILFIFQLFLCFFNVFASTSTDPLALFVSGPVGMAAAAAVATGKKRKRPHIFESNPSIRKRQQTRLLRSGLSEVLPQTSFTSNRPPTENLQTGVCVCVFFQEAASHPG